MADKTPKVTYDALGTTGLKEFDGFIDEEFLRSLRGRRGKKFFREMADNDPIVGAFLYAIEIFTRQVRWAFEESSQSKSALAARDFIEDAFGDMETTMDEFIVEVLTHMTYGFSFFEIVYKLRDDGMVGWESFAPRAQETLEQWVFSENNKKVLGVHQQDHHNSSVKKVFIPMEKALLFRIKVARGNPEGRSLLRNAARPYYYKKRTEEFESIGTERELTGYPVFEVPLEIMASDATAAQKSIRSGIEDTITGIRRDAKEGAVIPSEMDCDGNPTGYKLRLLTSGGQRQTDPDKIIRRYDSRIAMSVLAEFILLGSEKHGSWSLSSSKTDVFAVSVSAMLKSIQEVLQEKAINKLCKLNGVAKKDIPVLSTGDLETPPLEELAAFISALVTAGIPMDDMPTQKALRASANLPPPPEEQGLESLDETPGEASDRRIATLEARLDELTGKPSPKKEEGADGEG